MLSFIQEGNDLNSFWSLDVLVNPSRNWQVAKVQVK